ncbi:ribosomal protein L7/L12 [Tremella mesenterica]|uniref:Ribosomal protein L7/L12 n=1 Tax=Tremella mesenterica TaxID=5217 RepID=A0A4Q1BK78_TREME|nr:ribosomal protein L7/L12 [Tremella mesenterica]
MSSHRPIHLIRNLKPSSSLRRPLLIPSHSHPLSSTQTSFSTTSHLSSPNSNPINDISTKIDAPLSPEIAPLVESISSLTLIQVSELVSALKTRLNISDIPIVAPSNNVSKVVSNGEEGEGEGEGKEVVEKKTEKTIFTVKLEKFDTGAKAKIIREVKAMMPNMNLVEAKKFVESVPQILKENLPKEEAEKLQKTLTELGATVTLS